MENRLKYRAAIVLFIVAVGLLLSGCVDSKTSNSENSINTGIFDYNWCKKGTEYNSITSEGRLTMKIIGLTTYKDKTVCQSEFSQANQTIIMYTSQDGRYNWQVIKDIDGKTIYESGVNSP